MATKTESVSDIYQIKVTLLGTKPPIWRRLLVPADMTLVQLHNVLQIAMGWEDGHMHEFRVGQRRFGQPEPADPFMRMPRTESERSARLSALLERTGAKMIYTYDFGDSWEHCIVLEKQIPADHDTTYPSAPTANSPVRRKTAVASRAFMTFSTPSTTPTMNGMRS